MRVTPPVRFREAGAEDLQRIVELLADDPLGTLRERPGQQGLEPYASAFAAIAEDPSHRLIVAELGREVVGVLQLSFLPNLTYEGSWRAQIEGVRVAASHRSLGVGRALVERAVSDARERGCRLAQLTTDRRRPEALRFYESLGFEASHDGLKLDLRRGRTS